MITTMSIENILENMFWDILSYIFFSKLGNVNGILEEFGKTKIITLCKYLITPCNNVITTKNIENILEEYV